ncbi:hypothetical protein [Sorangium sp. So ce388]|uniref:hypothetical protein n=1 Tax=Sorangium sp. So ce388 TaxID=3133309 RepID=UPI003F5B63ED
MCATAANLIEDVLPEVAHRPWVLTFPFPWRRRLAEDGASFGVLTRLFVESVERFYEERGARRGACGAVKSGAVTVVQRTSGDMRFNPHLHVVFLDGAYHEDGTELVWNELGHLPTRAVGQIPEHAPTKQNEAGGAVDLERAQARTCLPAPRPAPPRRSRRRSGLRVSRRVVDAECEAAATLVLRAYRICVFRREPAPG